MDMAKYNILVLGNLGLCNVESCMEIITAHLIVFLRNQIQVIKPCQKTIPGNVVFLTCLILARFILETDDPSSRIICLVDHPS